MVLAGEIVEYTDPGCPWCWASEPTLRWLARQYGPWMRWRRVFGVQMDGEPGADGPEPVSEVHARWLTVARHGGVGLTLSLQRAHASTRPAALAAKAAERQGPAAADDALRALREAYFLAGRPPDNEERIVDALAPVPGLDVARVLQDMTEPGVLAALQADWRETRDPHPSVIGLAGPGPHPGAAKQEEHAVRYAFPTIIVRGSGGERVVPGWRPPAAYRGAVHAAAPELRRAPEPPALQADLALERYRSLTGADLALLTDGESPRSVAAAPTATTPVWRTSGQDLHFAVKSDNLDQVSQD
jgi:predicted DsbA family dithiol-disulfide isomerase